MSKESGAAGEDFSTNLKMMFGNAKIEPTASGKAVRTYTPHPASHEGLQKPMVAVASGTHLPISLMFETPSGEVMKWSPVFTDREHFDRFYETERSRSGTLISAIPAIVSHHDLYSMIFEGPFSNSSVGSVDDCFIALDQPGRDLYQDMFGIEPDYPMEPLAGHHRMFERTVPPVYICCDADGKPILGDWDGAFRSVLGFLVKEAAEEIAAFNGAPQVNAFSVKGLVEFMASGFNDTLDGALTLENIVFPLNAKTASMLYRSIGNNKASKQRRERLKRQSRMNPKQLFRSNLKALINLIDCPIHETDSMHQSLAARMRRG
jgi:hypothetical protein